MLKRLTRFLNPPPPNSYIWHQCAAPFPPRKSIDGSYTSDGRPTWRRITPDGWEYRQEDAARADPRMFA